MLNLFAALAAWNTPAFNDALKRELESAGPAALSLQQSLSASSYALDDGCTVMVIGVGEEPGLIRARVGVFFHGIIAGCSCADDPTPVEPQQEYVELEVAIDRHSAAATITPTGD
ncbi:hypothetical protein [Sulfurisoma sediminicola]|uniref:Uncharacterized protein n=1 Tax=Sulfurisoma sediminicola TaxID=1381557 RepID=A0A497XE15_9PROT|nr:hypothetical protein [Sulfurisoma sediminicola]RLJ64795.1 hypothetical protein DFR35_1443 [Sulfurisoma sediminicola]